VVRKERDKGGRGRGAAALARTSVRAEGAITRWREAKHQDRGEEEVGARLYRREGSGSNVQER
jgi:hypothetical protein